MIIRLYCGVFVQRAIQEREMHLITPYTGFHWKELNVSYFECSPLHYTT